MRYQPTRRAFLRTSIALTAGALGGCTDSRRELRVFCYAGGHERTLREVFVPAFEAETGARVSLQPGWWDGIAKLKASPANDPPFDLIISDATQGYPAARDGMFAQLNMENIPNHRNLVPSALDNWIFREGHGVPYPDSVMTLAFNASQIKNTLTRWADLLRPDLKGKVGLYNSFYMSLYTFACMKADMDNQAGTAHKIITKDLDSLLRFAREHRDQVSLWWPASTDMILALANGQSLAGNMHSPEYIQAMREKSQLGAAIPDADRAFVQVFWSVPAGSPNQDLAERAINAIFSETMQEGFARQGLATAVPSIAEKMAAEDPLWKRFYPHTADQLKNLRYYPYDVYAEHWDDLANAWERTILRAD